jgi:hypothetical protein
MTSCEKCGFVYESVPRHEVSHELRRAAREVRARLGAALERPGGEAALRQRREPEIWSALEYAGHLRDVFIVQRERLYLSLIEESPSFASIYRERRAELARYNEEDPATTGTEVVLTAELLGRAFDWLSDEQWQRTMVYAFVDPVQVDAAWLARHTLHEARHHLIDIDADLAATVVADG